MECVISRASVFVFLMGCGGGGDAPNDAGTDGGALVDGAVDASDAPSASDGPSPSDAPSSNVGCGASAHGASALDQSTCGNVGPFPAAAGGTAVSACGSFGAGHYTLAKDVGGDPTATCITFTGGPVVFDFAGHRVTGRMLGNNVALSGSHVFSSAAGGALTCSDASASLPGCVYFQASDPSATAPFEVDHLTLANQSSTSNNSERNLMIVWDIATTTLGATAAVHVHNVTSTSATGASSSRIVNLQFQGAQRAEFDQNDVTCLATAAACQGVVCYGAEDCKLHNNATHSQLAPTVTETARHFICDGNTGVGMNGCEIYANYIEVKDARGVRLRNVNSNANPVAVHDNLFDAITDDSGGNYIAALHLCDPDTGSNDASGYDLHDNTFRVSNGGNVVMERGCSGYPKLRDNVVSCTTAQCTGLFANVRQESTSTLELTNNEPIPMASSPQSNVEATASVHVCKSGTFGGAGQVTTITCP